jgi:hypothetical protein
MPQAARPPQRKVRHQLTSQMLVALHNLFDFSALATGPSCILSAFVVRDEHLCCYANPLIREQNHMGRADGIRRAPLHTKQDRHANRSFVDEAEKQRAVAQAEVLVGSARA